MRADWKQANSGREAKFYTLTRKGQSQLEAEVGNWKRQADAVALILQTVE